MVLAVLTVLLAALVAAYFAPLGDWVADNPLPGQLWMKENTGLGLVVFGVLTAVVAALAWGRDPAGAASATDQDGHDRYDRKTDGHLSDLRAKTRLMWIDQFLARSLERIVPAQLGFRERRDAITGPLRLVLPDSVTELDKDIGIADIFALDRTLRRLLILGKPGSGKTTQLLRLVEHLLADLSGPVPVVLSLATGTWKIDPYRVPGAWLPRKFDPLDQDAEAQWNSALAAGRAEQIDYAAGQAIEWLSWEIANFYDVPPKQVAMWLRLSECPIILMLDGLDEIRDIDDRRRCVGVLRALCGRLNVGMVVCSRTQEYFEVSRRLKFGTAVEITELTAEDVDDYLCDAGGELASLREACAQNPEIPRLLDTPLALTVAVLTYRGKQVDEVAVRSLLEERLDHLWSAYLKEALTRTRNPVSTKRSRLTTDETAGYLRGLAYLMDRGGHDVFTVESMRLSWVGRSVPAPRVTAVQLLYGLFSLAAVGVLILRATMVTGVVASLICLIALVGGGAYMASRFGRPGSGSTVDRADFVSTRWTLDWRTGLARGLATTSIGLLPGVMVGILGGVDGLLLGLLPGLAAGLVAGVLNLPERGIARVTPKPRKAVLAVWTTAMVRTCACVVALAAALALIFTVIPTVDPEVRDLVGYFSLSAAVGTWLVGCPLSFYGVWSHRVAVRAALRHGLLPKRIDDFLAHSEDRIIARRGLNGHMFLHRTLQAHLAEQHNASMAP